VLYRELLQHSTEDPQMLMFVDARECIARGHNLMMQYSKKKGVAA